MCIRDSVQRYSGNKCFWRVCEFLVVFWVQVLKLKAITIIWPQTLHLQLDTIEYFSGLLIKFVQSCLYKPVHKMSSTWSSTTLQHLLGKARTKLKIYLYQILGFYAKILGETHLHTNFYFTYHKMVHLTIEERVASLNGMFKTNLITKGVLRKHFQKNMVR